MKKHFAGTWPSKGTPKQLHLPYPTCNLPPLSETGRSLLGWTPLFFTGRLLAFHLIVRNIYQRRFLDLCFVHTSHRSLPSAFMVDSFKFRATVVHNHSQDVSCKVLHCFGSLVGTVARLQPGAGIGTSHPLVRTIPSSSPSMSRRPSSLDHLNANNVLNFRF